MGTKFLLRSNQGLELTPEGRVAFANISHILAEYDAFLASFQRSQKEPPQKISITCPSVLADCDLIGLIRDFQKRYPQTYFEIYDTPEEIKGEPDLSYWFGTPAGRDKSRLQPICSFHPVLAVAPSYIEKYGEPKEPEDILKTSVFFFYRPTGGEGKHAMSGLIRRCAPARICRLCLPLLEAKAFSRTLTVSWLITI